MNTTKWCEGVSNSCNHLLLNNSPQDSVWYGTPCSLDHKRETMLTHNVSQDEIHNKVENYGDCCVRRLVGLNLKCTPVGHSFVPPRQYCYELLVPLYGILQVQRYMTACRSLIALHFITLF